MIDILGDYAVKFIKMSWGFSKMYMLNSFFTQLDLNLMWLSSFLQHIYQIWLIWFPQILSNLIIFSSKYELHCSLWFSSKHYHYFSQEFNSYTACFYFLILSSYIHLSKQRYFEIKKKTSFSFKLINIYWCVKQWDRSFIYKSLFPLGHIFRHEKNFWNLKLADHSKLNAFRRWNILSA